MLDAFDHEYIPEHLLTREFLAEVKSLLSPQGVLVGQHVLVEPALRPRVDDLRGGVRHLLQPEARANRVIVARPAGLPDDASLRSARGEYETGAAHLRRGRDVGAAAVHDARRTGTRGARVLTDQYSPANLLNR